MKHFNIYGRSSCGACNNAKTLVATRGVDFNYYEIGVDVTREKVVEKFGAVRSIPQITVIEDGFEIHLGGYQELSEYFNETAMSENTLIEG